MADAILMSGGTNGATSNDVTASKAQVLQGYKTVTSDSDDEIIEGIIQVVDTSQNDYRKTRTTEYGLDKSRNIFYMHLPQRSAFYTRPDNTPHVEVDANVLGDATTGKVLKNSIFTSKYGLAMQGAIELRGTWVIASEVVNASGEGTVHVRFEEGYYSNDGQYKPTAKIPYAVLSNVLGIDANKIVSSATYAGITGAVIDKGNGTPANNTSSEMFYYEQYGGYAVRFEPGAYYLAGAQGQWKPIVTVPVSLVKAAVNYHPEATLDNVITCNERGKVAVIDTKVNNYALNTAKNIGLDLGRSKLWMILGYGNAYYCRDDNNPHVEVDASRLGDAKIEHLLEGTSASSKWGLNFPGAIKRWICTTGDVISAVNGEGFAWDDIYAGRGRGIVMKILNKHFVQDANWVFLSSPNLYPHNVVKNININGVIGTRDFVDKVNEYMIATDVEISMQNRNQSIPLGNAYANSETVFFGVETVGEDVWDGFVRRDKGNGRYLIGRIPVSKNDSNLLGTFIRNTPVQIEISRDGAGNISLIHHGPNQVLGATKLNIYIYAHSSISFRF